jgi:hypothetical protein
MRHTCGISFYAGAMKFMRSTWTDSRLDDLNGRVTEISNRLDGLSTRVDGLQHTMIAGFLTLVVIMVGGFMGLAGLIVSKL